MRKTIYISIYFALLSILTQLEIFGMNYWISTIPIFLYSFCFFAVCFTNNKYWNLLVSFLAHISFLAILMYHKIFDDCLTLSVMVSQWHEGVQAFYRSKEALLFNNIGLFCVISVILISVILFKCQIKAISRKIKLVLFIFIATIICFTCARYNYEDFSYFEFNAEVKHFGYPVAWIYELTTHAGEQQLRKKLEENVEYKKLEEFQNISIEDNIYIIQFESLDYNALKSGAMPFIESILKDSAVYKIKEHIKKSSANADFAVLSLLPIYNESISVLYKKIDSDYFAKRKNLVTILKDKGYKTYFYHGNHGEFFYRRPHIEKMGFNEFYFRENLQDKYSASEWGVNDQDIAHFISKKNKEGKNLHFFITVTSHFDFSLGATYTKHISQPQTIRDKYLNTINYTDTALKTIIETAPKNSIFIIYSDHDSDTSNDKTTAFIIYNKNKKISQTGTIEMQNIPIAIKQIINNEL